jgi:DNA-binding phage protein
MLLHKLCDNCLADLSNMLRDKSARHADRGGTVRKWEDSLKERLSGSSEYVNEYLNAVLEETDPEALRLALQHVAEARGIKSIIETASSYELPRLASTLDALGMHLIVAPKQAA